MDALGDGRTTSRRAVLAGAAGLGFPLLGTAPDSANDLTKNPRFPEGVMSGVPRLDGATLWTRVPRGLLDGNATIALLVSRHEDLSRPDIVTTVVAQKISDGCVHFEATGLRPGEQYFYQFRGRDNASPIGRFRTLRPADSRETTRIGFFTCQGYTEGYYATHKHLAEEDLDLVVCLGDYVYEASVPGVRGIDLNLYPQLLPAMRAKYRAYRRDENLRAMHARHAFLPIWDDHEFRNNYTKNKWTIPEPLFQRKKRAAWHAWFERMPVPRFPHDITRTYRTLRLGRTVELFALDSRQYRDDQPCGDSGGTVCADVDDPSRTLLGADQKAWLEQGLQRSRATWKVLANQNMMMGMVNGAKGERAYFDTWDGYGAERTELLSLVADRVDDLVVVTGDDHDSFAGELWNTGFGPSPGSGLPMPVRRTDNQRNPGGTNRAGVEFVVPSVTSTNTGDSQGASGAAAEEQNRLSRNPHLKYVDMKQHGYGILAAGRDQVAFTFRSVDPSSPSSPVRTTRRFTVDRGRPILE